jgi:hypothetical protein
MRTKLMVSTAFSLFLIASCTGPDGSADAEPDPSAEATAVIPEVVPADLDSPYTLKQGEFLAITLRGYFEAFGSLASWDSAVLYSYSQEKDAIVVVVMGGRDSIDGAKESLDKFVETVFEPMLDVIEQAQGIRLGDQSFEVAYVNRHKMKPMITLRGGEYVLP